VPAIHPLPDVTELAQNNLRLRGDLLTIATRVSHDLRTPLGSISTNCDMLRETLADHDTAVKALFDSVFRSTDEMARLIERVGFLLKASANPDQKRTVSMADPVLVASQRLERRILARKASVSRPTAWPEVQGVGTWLETIWWNFLANALQHGKAAPKIELGWRESATDYFFWVADDGVPVPAEVRHRLFQPFDTLYKTDSTRGLGLSIVQRLTELQGGTCGYDPAQGHPRFFFSLPKPGSETGPRP